MSKTINEIILDLQKLKIYLIKITFNKNNMSKELAETYASSYKERFQFKLMIGDNVICQRYFRIHGASEKAIESLELKEAIDLCVEIIKDDLKAKSLTYTWLMEPYTFTDETEMEQWVNKYKDYYKFDVGTPFKIRGVNGVEHIWDGKQLKKVVFSVDANEYLDEVPQPFKFIFIDNDREVISKIFDSTVYPKYIRNSVDLSNYRGKIKKGNKYEVSPDMWLLNQIVKEREDLVPIIRSIITDVCSSNAVSLTEYRDEKLGKKKTYDFNVHGNVRRFYGNYNKGL